MPLLRDLPIACLIVGERLDREKNSWKYICDKYVDLILEMQGVERCIKD